MTIHEVSFVIAAEALITEDKKLLPRRRIIPVKVTLDMTDNDGCRDC